MTMFTSLPRQNRFGTVIPGTEVLERSQPGPMTVVESEGCLGREMNNSSDSVQSAVCSGLSPSSGQRGSPQRVFERGPGSVQCSVQLACAVGINTYTKTSQNGIH